MRCAYRENRIYCGSDYMDVQIYPVYEVRVGSRSRRKKPTSDTQQRLNDDNAAKRLSRLIMTNFCSSDYALHLTYDNENVPKDSTEAKRDVQNFIRRAKRYYASSGINEIKYIWTTEQGGKSGRLHHHLIISGGVSRDKLERIWGKGYANSKRLQFNENGVEGLSRYITKSPVFFRKWSGSKNLNKPVERKNDYRYSRYRAERLYDARNSLESERKLLEKMYEGYRLTHMEAVCNSVNNGFYITMRLYRPHSLYRSVRFDC